VLSAAQPRPAAPLEADAVMDWAEQAFPAFFPSAQPSQTLAPYRFRFYPETATYLGIAGPDIFVLGPAFGPDVLAVGPMEAFRCEVVPEQCGLGSRVGVAVADRHGLALRADGTVLAWGEPGDLVVQRNQAGGAAVAGPSVRAVPGLVATRIAAGGTYSLALDAQGQLWGWGLQEGSALPTGAFSPSGPVVYPGMTGLVDVVAGSFGPVAVRQNGTVVHWPGETRFAPPAGTSAGNVAGLTGVARVVRGPSSVLDVLAIDGAGGVTGLQFDLTAQGTSQVLRTTLTPLPGLGPVRDIACGRSMVAGQACLLLRRDGTVAVWTGQTSQAPVAVPGLRNVTQVAGNGDPFAVRTRDGRLWTWGTEPRHGQRQMGSLPAPVELRAMRGTVAVAVGTRGLGVVVRSDGTLHAWGDLASTVQPDAQFRNHPVALPGVDMTAGAPAPSLAPLAAVAAPGQTVTFRAEVPGATSWRWRRNGVPVLGAESPQFTTPALRLQDDGAFYEAVYTAGGRERVTRPVRLTVLPTATRRDRPARVVGDTLYAYTATSPVTWAWGDGRQEIGAQVARVWEAPGRFAAQAGAERFEVEAVASPLASGLGHDCFLRADRTVACRGRNDAGQLGDGTAIDRADPVPVPGLQGVVGLAAGERFTCAITPAGGVQCWGQNFYGQLGDGTRTGRSLPQAVPGLSGVTALVAGAHHVCALVQPPASAAGQPPPPSQVRCWGFNGSSGTVGDGTTAEVRTSPVTLADLTDVTGLSAWGYSTCAVRRSGEVRCWGSMGAAGVGSSRPVAVAGLVDAATVALGEAHACALRRDRSVVCWGQNTFSQLGDGGTTNRATPGPVAGPSDVLANVVALSAGRRHTCALRGDRQLACWGQGAVGVPAVGTDTQGTARTPRLLADVVDVAALRAGERTCVIDEGGEAFCWGNFPPLSGASFSETRQSPWPVPGERIHWR
jgi:alpha-tubulin suppressor-like RCC1 family protein